MTLGLRMPTRKGPDWRRPPLHLPRKRLLRPRLAPAWWNTLIRGPGGGLLRGPLGGLATSLSCCCDPTCCPEAGMPAALTFSVLSGTGDCAGCAPYSFTINEDSPNNYSGTSDPDFCEANLSGTLNCVDGVYVIGAHCVAGTIFGSANATLISCDPFHATATITLDDGSGCGTPPEVCCCGDLEIEITE